MKIMIDDITVNPWRVEDFNYIDVRCCGLTILSSESLCFKSGKLELSGGAGNSHICGG